MSDYRVICEQGGNSAELILSDGSFFGFPKWRCVEGEAVWGTPATGTCLSPNLTSGSIELSLGTVISDWSPNEGASGSGYRLSDNGGNFPEGDFAWQIIDIA